MTKEEKKMLRLKAARLLDNCEGCKHRYTPNASVHICPSCPIGQQIQQIGKQLEQDDVGYAGEERRSWTKEEDFYLINHYGIVDTERIAKQLNRTTEAIKRRIYVLRKQGDMSCLKTS
ncbi:SANT/Myb-like DNA-binding domain-containing protein [Anoxybacillus rupiensis]|uniref:SANT/Myb-like DNA-binding domain-containing protein n=1 Tax=Anoxybacteroides rupiense TaxID=311460 RepID=A0ABD5IYG4_9BACL|nr:SANT/Myb-like DNA-binding domain-containing protein [Anoxybacillus rupiensis]